MDDDELLDEDLEDEELVGDGETLDVDDVEDIEDVPLDPDADDPVGVDVADVVDVVADEEADEGDDEVPVARKKRPVGEEDDEDEEELDPDDVEADLDTILKVRIAAGDDDDDDEDEVDEPGVEPGERVAAKGADEFTCPTCFLIVHPRQFGRPGALTCPEGYDPCGAIPIVTKINKRAKRG